MCRTRRSLRVFDYQLVQQHAKKNKKIPATLQSVEYKCQIINNILKTTLIQTFRSQSDQEYSETIYMFPIHENVCLESFQARYNDKTIQGIVKAKQDAQIEYQSNKKQGNFVTYAETQKNKREEYIKIMIGNLPPGVQVEIVLSFSEQIESIFNKYYVACIPLKYVEDEISSNLDKNVLTLDLFCTGQITYSTSKGYPAQKTIIDNNTAKFTLSQSFLQKNIDFQLVFSFQGMFDPQVILGSSKVYHEDSVKRNILPVRNSAMISFIPNFNQKLTCEIDDTIRAAIINGDDILSDKYQQKLNEEIIDHLDSSRSEFIFLLDRSYSMEGKPIKKAVEALTLFLKSLPNDCYFNIIPFCGTFYKVFSKSVQYNSKNMNKAIESINYIVEFNFWLQNGHTDIYQPLQDIFNNEERIKGYNKQIFLLTDGQVKEPENVINLIKKNNKFNRVHSIGFGSGADKFLIEQSSIAGKGIHKMIELTSDLSEVIINMLARSITPTYDDFTLIYDKSIFDSTHPTQTDFPCFFKDEMINIHLFFKPLIDIQTLTDDQKMIQIKYYDSKKKMRVNRNIRLEMSDCFAQNAGLQESVFKLGQQLYINENMEQNKGGDDLIQQAIDFQLMTEKTALICVIESLNDEQKIMYQNINNQNVYSNNLKEFGQPQIQQPQISQTQGKKQQKKKQIELNREHMRALLEQEKIREQREQMEIEKREMEVKEQEERERERQYQEKLNQKMKIKIKKSFKYNNKTEQEQLEKVKEKETIKQQLMKEILKSFNDNENEINSLNQNSKLISNEKPSKYDDNQDIQINQKIKNITSNNNNTKPQSEESYNIKSEEQEIRQNDNSIQEQQQLNQITQQPSKQKSKQQNKQKNEQPLISLKSILNLVDSEGVWQYDIKLIQDILPQGQEITKEYIKCFKNNNAFMTTFILSFLQLLYYQSKSKWILIQKKAIHYVNKYLNYNQSFNTIQSQLIQLMQSIQL